MKRVFLFFIIFLSAIYAQPSGKNKNFKFLTAAVSEFRTQGIPPNLQWLGKSFADALINKLSYTRTVRIVEREYLEQIVGELKLQMSGLIDEQRAVQVGRLLGARVFIFGSISMLDDYLVVRTRIVSVKRGEILGVADAKGDEKNIFEIQDDLARQVSSILSVESVIIGKTPLEISNISIGIYKDLDRLRNLSKGLPFLGLDPARSRKKGEYQLALSLCDKILSQYPKLAEAHYYRALFSLNNEEFDLAERETKILVTLNPHEIDYLLLKANVFYVTNDISKALNTFQEISKKFPSDSRAWYGIGRLFVKSGKEVEAIPAFILSIELAPMINEAETNLQTLLRGNKATELLEKLQTYNPKYYPPAYLFFSLWNKKWNNVGDLAKETIKNFPNLYIGYFLYGLLELKDKHREKAISLFHKCLTLRPYFPEVHRELGLLLLKNNQCLLGKQHLNIYLHTVSYIDDYDKLERYIQQCKK